MTHGLYEHGSIVPVFNAIPGCVKGIIFYLSPSENCRYIGEAQRFLTTT